MGGVPPGMPAPPIIVTRCAGQVRWLRALVQRGLLLGVEAVVESKRGVVLAGQGLDVGAGGNRGSFPARLGCPGLDEKAGNPSRSCCSMSSFTQSHRQDAGDHE